MNDRINWLCRLVVQSGTIITALQIATLALWYGLALPKANHAGCVHLSTFRRLHGQDSHRAYTYLPMVRSLSSLSIARNSYGCTVRSASRLLLRLPPRLWRDSDATAHDTQYARCARSIATIARHRRRFFFAMAQRSGADRSLTATATACARSVSAGDD